MECRCQMTYQAEDRQRKGGMRSRLARLLGRGQKEVHTAEDQQTHKDLYGLMCEDDWDSILSSSIEGQDILDACELALSKGDTEGAANLLSGLTMHTQPSDSHCPSLDSTWQNTFTQLVTHHDHLTAAMDLLARAEKDTRYGGEKTLLNRLIHTLLTLQTPCSDRSPAQRMAQWCQEEGHYTFGFDIALTSGNFREAYSILRAVDEVSTEHALMLVDVATQSRDKDRAVSFMEFCLEKSHVDFAFDLATGLQVWSVVEENIESEMRSPSQLRRALNQCVLHEKWDIVSLLLEYMLEDDVSSMLLHASRPYDVSKAVDLLVEQKMIPLALRLACSFGMAGKAASILRETQFVMDSQVSAATAAACFDSHCRPEEFPGHGWHRGLLQHVLQAPSRKPFSDPQWQCVLTLFHAGLGQQAAVQLFRRAVEENAACLDRFMDRGLDDELMDVLLTHQPEKDFSENQLNCVVKLLYKAAGVDMNDVENVLTDEAVELAQTRMDDLISGKETPKCVPDTPDGCQGPQEQEPFPEQESRTLTGEKGKSPEGEHWSQTQTGEKPEFPEGEDWSRNHTGLKGKSPKSEDWSQNQTEEKRQFPEGEDWSSAVPYVLGIPVSPWRYVMKAAQAGTNSRHVHQLAIRSVQEGEWNCFICLAIEGLHQHPLDLLLPLLHQHPERLVTASLRLREGLVCTEDILYFDNGWVKFRHDIDVMNLHSRGLLEERHRMVLVERALSYEDWNTLMRLSALDLPLWTRRAIFTKAMDKRQWLLAKEMFHQLPDKASPDTFQNALKELTNTSEQLYTWMKEAGLYSAYLAPEMFTNLLKMLDKKEAEAGRSEQRPQPSLPFWRRWRLFPPKPTSSHDLRRPNPAVRATERDRVTSTQGKAVLKAATKGDWGAVMVGYEGGMGEGVKMAVMEEAVKQEQWSVVTALIRRDPEAEVFYTQWAGKTLIAATYSAAWPCIEAMVDRLCTQDDRDWLFPYALRLARWSLVLTLMRKGVRAQFRAEALLTASRSNEWSLVTDLTLHIAETHPKELSEDLKKAAVKSMSRMISTLQPSSPWTTTSDLHLMSKVEEKGEGRGQGEGDSDRSGTGGAEGEGEEEEEEEREWRSEDGSTVLQVAAGLQLWSECKALLHCGVTPHPSPTPSYPLPVILLALRHDKADVIHLLLDFDLPCDVLDQTLRELLLTPDLDLDADVSLLSKLLESRKRHSPSTGLRDVSSTTVDVTESSCVISDVSHEAGRLLEAVCLVLKEAKAVTFQPFVAQAVETGRVIMPAFLSEQPSAEGHVQPLKLGRGGSVDSGSPGSGPDEAASGPPRVLPRVSLRVEKEPLASPVLDLLPSL